MPQLGLGTWKIEKQRCAEVVQTAAQLGYRHFDCACDYGNEEEVGQGLAQVIRTKIAPRDQLWVTSKLWNTYHEPAHVRGACERSLRDLGLDYLDLYLIHFPISLRYVSLETRYPPGWFYDPEAPSPRMEPIAVPLWETWQAMENLVQAGLVRHIGICNFNVALIRELLASSTIRPSVLQVEMHPYLPQEKLLRYCRQEKIAVTAFSSFGAESYVPLKMAEPQESLMRHAVVQAIASQQGRSPAQVLLRWGVQRGTIVIPKASSREHLAQNADIFHWELTDQQMQQLSQLESGRRFNDPGVFCERAFNTFFPIFE